jgi:hypothetical protein
VLAEIPTTAGDAVDDRALKIFAKLDADFPAERVQALEMLRAHNQKVGQSFRGIASEFGNAAEAVQKNADLQKRYDDAIQKYGELEQLYRKAAADNAQWAQQHQIVTRPVSAYHNTAKMRHPWRAIGLLGLVLLVGAGAYFWHSDPSPFPPRAEGDLRAIARQWGWRAGDSDTVMVRLGGEPYWLIARGDLDASARSDSRPPRCLHFYVVPAEVEDGDFAPPHPYSLFGFGWIDWPERFVRCERR